MYPATATPTKKPHVAVCPSAGMGHVAPLLRLASALSFAPYECTVTLVVVVPFITTAESDEISSFFTSHPHIHRVDFHIDLATPPANVDPFFFRYVAISQSAHQLACRLSTLSPPISAAFSDFLYTKGINTTLSDLPNPYPNYTFIITSARFLSLMAYLPQFLKSPPLPGHPAEIPGLDSIPADSIPPPFFNPDSYFTSLAISNVQYISLSNGILVNTFDSFELETLSAFKSGKALPNSLPPITTVGPLRTHETGKTKRDGLMSWLDGQPDKSVIYVSFGNRTAMSREQIAELGMGLEMSECLFLWVVKTSMVDKEEKDELVDLLGQDLHKKLCKRGKVVKQWVNQYEILGHKAVGWFLSHCGWNSVTEAARNGVPILAWPQHGDQRVNAEVVEKAGLGVWERGWGAGGRVVESAEIREKVKLVMGMEALKQSAMRVGVEAKKACREGGSSTAALMSIIRSFKQNDKGTK